MDSFRQSCRQPDPAKEVHLELPPLSHPAAAAAPHTSVAKTTSELFGLQVEHGVHPHLVFDVRHAPAEPLPSELKGALNLPGELQQWE
jgi:hypothetical protein